jgi:hypothetical protein
VVPLRRDIGNWIWPAPTEDEPQVRTA